MLSKRPLKVKNPRSNPQSEGEISSFWGKYEIFNIFFYFFRFQFNYLVKFSANT